MNTCPACGMKNTELLFSLNIEEPVESKLYKDIVVRNCMTCSHLYNQISKTYKANISKQYRSQSAVGKSKLHREGRSSEFSQYKDIFDVVRQLVHDRSKLLDVGCGSGDFLKLMINSGVADVHGIEVSPSLVSQINLDIGTECALLADAENLPYPDSIFDLVVIDQVLEHVFNPTKVIEEASRVLKEDGYVIFGVPNRERYGEKLFFPYYEFLIKEHVHHFSQQSLQSISERFRLQSIINYERWTNYTGGDYEFPNLICVFQKSTSNVDECTSKMKISYFNFKRYLEINETLTTSLESIIERNLEFATEIYLWGASRELLFLLPKISQFSQAAPVKIIDSDPEKRGFFESLGLPVLSPESLPSCTSHSTLLITAVSHTRAIEKLCQNLGFRGTVVSLR